jgi:hypothetical protein
VDPASLVSHTAYEVSMRKKRLRAHKIARDAREALLLGAGLAVSSSSLLSLVMAAADCTSKRLEACALITDGGFVPDEGTDAAPDQGVDAADAADD